MKRINAIELRQALSNKELRAKHLTGNNLVSLAFLKRELSQYFETMAEAEDSLAESHNINRDPSGNFILGDNKDFIQKLKEIQAVPFESKHLNFIEGDVANKFVSETDVNTATIVYEHLTVKPG